MSVTYSPKVEKLARILELREPNGPPQKRRTIVAFDAHCVTNSLPSLEPAVVVVAEDLPLRAKWIVIRIVLSLGRKVC